MTLKTNNKKKKSLSSGKKIFSSIEKAATGVFYSIISIPDFINRSGKSAIPLDYRTATGIDLSIFEPAIEYCSYAEIERVAGARSLKRQIEWLCGRVTLKELLGTVLFPCQGYRDIIINYSQTGRPYILKHENIAISLSHSCDLAMAAVHTIPGKRIGIDVEKSTGVNFSSVLPVAFTEEERAFYKDKSTADIIKAFTIKEAYLKLIGLGFHEVIKKVTVIDNILYFDGKKVEESELFTILCPDRYCASLIFDIE